MPAPESMLDLYLHLASAADAEARPIQRDKFLILAAGIAQTVGYAGIAEDCRLRVLENNPNHLLRQFATVREALRSSEVRYYIRQLLRLYPFEKAEFLLMKYRDGGYQGHHGYDSLHASDEAPPKPTPEEPNLLPKPDRTGRPCRPREPGARPPRTGGARQENRSRRERRFGGGRPTRPRPALERAFREQAKANEVSAIVAGKMARPIMTPSVPTQRPALVRRLPTRFLPLRRRWSVAESLIVLVTGVVVAGTALAALLFYWR